MDYTWNKKDLIQRKKDLIKLKEKNRFNFNLSKAITDDICVLNDLINVLKERELIYFEDPKLIKKRAFDEYKRTPDFIKEWILNTKKILSKYDTDTPIEEVRQQTISDDDLITLSHDFYQWIPNKNYRQLIERYTNKDEHLLYIKHEENQAYYGFTSVIYFPMYAPYILLYRINTIEDFITLNHELAHCIYFAWDKNKEHYFKELEGYSFDYLSLEFLKEKKIIDSSTLEHLQITFFDQAIYKFYEFFLTSVLFQNRHCFNQDLLEYQIKQKFPCNIPSNLKQSITYIISFLTSLDLDFEKDPEQAFYTFEKIRTSKSNDMIKTLDDNGITFMSDNYMNLRKTMKKLHLLK